MHPNFVLNFFNKMRYISYKLRSYEDVMKLSMVLIALNMEDVAEENEERKKIQL